MVAMSAPPAPPSFNGPPRGVAVRRSRRRPWISAAVVLIVVSGALGLVGNRALGQRISVLQVVRDVEAGQLVAAEDLRAVDVAVDGPVQLLAAADRARVVGLSAAGRLPAGTLVSPADFEVAAGVPAGQVVVGAVLAPGELPTADLRVGDRVRLIQVAGASAPASADAAGASLGEATVYAVAGGWGEGGSAPSVESGGQFVSLAVSEGQAGKVAQASAARALRLIFLPGGAR
jgi:hypothetical protein